MEIADDLRLRPSRLTAAEVGICPQLCHPERTPDFLLRGTNQRQRMRLSSRKAAPA